MSITFARQPDGKYVRHGSLDAKWATIEIAGQRPTGIVRRVNRCVEIIESAIAEGHARAEFYAIRPAEAPAAMSEEAKSKLAALNAQRKEQKLAEKKRLDEENREAKADYRKRFVDIKPTESND